MIKKYTLISMLLLFCTNIFAQKMTRFPERLTDRKTLENQYKPPDGLQYFKNYIQQRELMYKIQPDSRKSSLAVKHRLDSIIGQYYDEENLVFTADVYSYDEENQLTSSVSYSRNTPESQWIPAYKSEYIYNENGSMAQSLEFEWDDISSQWGEGEKEEYTYDEKGNLIQEIWYYQEIITNPWEKVNKVDYTLDENDKLLQTRLYSWDETLSDWIPVFIDYNYDYIYDSNGNLITIIHVNDFHGDDFIDSLVTDLTYDANNNLTQQISRFWAGPVGPWIGFNRTDYSYYENNNLEVETGFAWDFLANDWKFQDREEYFYNPAGKLTSSIEYNRNNDDTQWLPRYKYEILYDNNANLVQEIEYDYFENDWLGSQRTVYTYNNSYTFSDLILPTPLFDGDEEAVGLFTHMLTKIEEEYWETISGQWLNEESYTLYYSEQQVTSTSSTILNEISVYPNPVSDYLTVNIPANNRQFSFELYDLQGRKVLSKLIINDERISLQGLNKGVYFYHITDHQKSHKGKLIKK
jgi:antitoxin component YwqK of YwqJK toxin-antitoxin module